MTANEAFGRARHRAAGPARLGVCLALVMLGARLGLAAESDAVPKVLDLTQVPLETLMAMEVPSVYGASKFEQKASAAPSSVSVISSEEIKRYGYRTLADVLRSTQGLHVSYDRNYAFLGVRGVNLLDFNCRVLLLVDGHRVNSSLTGGAYIDTAFLLDVDLIDRVEVIRGPGSALYGNNAFFGVINVITRTGRQLDGFEVSGSYGEFDAYKGRVSYGKAFTNGLELLLSGSLYDSQGEHHLYYSEFNTPALNNGVADDRDGDFFGSGFGSLGYGDLTLQGGYIQRKKDNPTGQYSLGNATDGASTFNDSRLRTTDERGYADLKYAHCFPEFAEVTARVYYDWTEYKIGYPYKILNGGAVVSEVYSKERDQGEWWGSELQLTKELWERHVLTAGAEYKDDFRLDQRIYDGNTGQTVPGGSVKTNWQNYGFYAQGDFEVLTNLHFNAGLRYDKCGDYDGSLNPRLALIYQPLEKSTLKAIYGTAFRAPNFWELSYSGFQDLQPEEITGYELAYEQQIARNWRSSISAFYNEMDDLIVFQNGTYSNLDADARGIEIALAGAWASGVRGQLSYTLQKAENRSSGPPLPDSPEHLIKLNVSVPVIKEKLFAGLELQYTSSRNSLHNTQDAAGQPLTVRGTSASDYTVLNFTLFSRNLVKNLEFSASVYNLLNQHYDDPASHFHVQDLIEQEGRAFRVQLTYRF